MMLLCMEVDSKIFFFPNFEIVTKMEAVIGIITLYIKKIRHCCTTGVKKKLLCSIVCNAKLAINNN